MDELAAIAAALAAENMTTAGLWLALGSPWLVLGGLLVSRIADGWTGPQRALALVLACAVYCGILLQALPDFYLPQAGAELPVAPLLTLGGMFGVVAAAYFVFGTDIHPITATARALQPPKAYAFHVLGMTAVLLATASVAFGWYPLPLALAAPGGSVVIELVHCALSLALWKIDALLLRWLCPNVAWPDGATSLRANYAREHGANPVGAPLACLGVVWFEVYVQQMLAAPLTLAGWPLLAASCLIAASAGLVRATARRQHARQHLPPVLAASTRRAKKKPAPARRPTTDALSRPQASRARRRMSHRPEPRSRALRRTTRWPMGCTTDSSAPTSTGRSPSCSLSRARCSLSGSTTT